MKRDISAENAHPFMSHLLLYRFADFLIGFLLPSFPRIHYIDNDEKRVKHDYMYLAESVNWTS